MKDLESDLRKVMQPNTGTNLKESKRNVLKDFVHIAGPLGVTHFMILTATENASYLRVAKTPRVSSTCGNPNGLNGQGPEPSCAGAATWMQLQLQRSDHGL